MLSAKQLEQVIVEYVDNQSAQYGVMIDGTWGSGKTYLWKQHIAKTLENSGKKTIHISLFGVKDLTEIERKIFNQVLSIAQASDSGLKDFLSQAINFWDSQDGGVNLGKTNFAPVFTFISNVTEYFLMQKMFFEQKENYVLCFDDFERLDPSISIIQALGTVNEYVENYGIKTVLICNEEQLKKQEPYSSWKEKFIYYTYSLSTSMEKMIDYYTGKYSEPSQGLLRNNSEFIVSLFTNLKLNNIRTLDICLNNCRHVILQIAKINHDFEEYRDLIQFICSLTIELKTNLPAKKDLESLRQWSELGYNSGKLSALPKNNDNEAQVESYLSQFLTNYYYQANSSSFLMRQVTSKAVFDFIATGYLDPVTLESDVARIVSYRLTPEKIFEGEHWLLEQDEFDRILKSKLDDLAEDRITKPVSIIKLAQKLFYLSRYQLIAQSDSDLKSLFIDSINRLVRKGKLEFESFNSGDSFYQLYDSDGNLTSNAEYNIIVSTIDQQNKEVYLIPIRQEAAQLLEQLKADFDSTIQSIYQDTRRYAYRPFIAGINIYQFKELIIRLNNRQLAELHHLFVSGSLSGRILGGHKLDLDNLRKLKNLFDTYIAERSKSPLPIKIYSLSLIRDQVEAAIAQL